MENNTEVPITKHEIPTTSREDGVFLIPISDIKEEPLQIKTEDITDEEFLECIGVTADNIKNEPGYEGEYLESDCSESNLVINEEVVSEKQNEDNPHGASALAEFIEANKLVVDYEAHITQVTKISKPDDVLPSAVRKRRILDVDSSHRYKCGICFVRFTEKRKIKQHMSTHGDDNDECYCNCNGFSTPMNSAELYTHKHIKQHKMNKCLRCEECGKTFVKDTELEEHSALRSHRCPVCTTLTFASCIAVKHHQVIHHNDTFSCTKCGKLFRFIELFRKHCTDCEYCACEICSKLFKSSEFLRRHIEMQHLNVDDVFQCHACEKVVEKYEYDTHECSGDSVVRRAKLPVSAPQVLRREKTDCEWSVPIESTVEEEAVELEWTKAPKKRNTRAVKGEYACEYCNRIYPWMRSLRRHVSDTHPNTKMYWCSRCQKVFRFKCSLDIHKCIVSKKMEKGLPLSCPACPSRYYSPTALSKHIVRHHPQIVDCSGQATENFESEDSIEEVPAEGCKPAETAMNTEMRAAELFHMFTEDFEDDLILINTSDRIEEKDEPKPLEPEQHESIDEYLQSTDRIDRIQISMDNTSEDSDPEIIESLKDEPLEVEDSEEEDNLLEGLTEHLEQLPSNDVEKNVEDTKENIDIYFCQTCKFSEYSFSKYIDHWRAHGFHLSVCPQCEKKIESRSEFVSHINSHVHDTYRKCRMYKVKSLQNDLDRKNKYSCRICGMYISPGRRFNHWEMHFIHKTTNIKRLKSLKVEKSDHKIKNISVKEDRRHEKFKFKTRVDSADQNDPINLYRMRNPCNKSMMTHLKKLKLLEKLAATENAMDPELDIKVEILSDDELDEPPLPVTATQLEKICALCNKKFSRMQCLKRHLIEHIVNSIMHKKYPDQEFKCRLCDNQTFTKLAFFKRHLRQHADLPMYDCELCHKSFADSSNYAKHKKVHGLQFMQCDMCARRFNTKRMLISHMKYHEENKPLPCPICKKQFYFSSSLKKHVRLVHKRSDAKTPLYPCKNCMLRFGSLKEKWIHQWNVHGIRKHNIDCPICHHGYRTLGELRRHLLFIHQIHVQNVRQRINIRNEKNNKNGKNLSLKKLLASRK